MRRFLGCRALALAAVLGLLAAAPASAELRKVTVGMLFISADSGLFIAKEKGYFAEQGLDVDFNRFTSGADQIPLLASDRLDVGSGGSTPGLFNAYLRGFNVPIVSSKAIISPDVEAGNVVVVRTDLWDSGTVRTAKDLKGLKIVVNNIQSPSLNYVARAAAAGGLTKDDVTVLEMPFDQFVPALQKKAVDAALPFSPLSETITEKLKVGVALHDTALNKTSANDTANMMFYSQGFMKEDAAAKGFMLAHTKAQRDFYRAIYDGGDKVEICTMLHKYLPYVAPDCSGMALAAIDTDGKVNVGSLERYQADWVKWGMMREPADIKAHVNMTYAEFAVGKLGPYRK